MVMMVVVTISLMMVVVMMMTIDRPLIIVGELHVALGHVLLHTLRPTLLRPRCIVRLHYGDGILHRREQIGI